jgi:hypothetical protein
MRGVDVNMDRVMWWKLKEGDNVEMDIPSV